MHMELVWGALKMELIVLHQEKEVHLLKDFTEVQVYCFEVADAAHSK